MVGYGHNFEHHDKLCPYDIRTIGATGSLGSKTVTEVFEKTTDRVVLSFERAYAHYAKTSFAPFIRQGKWLAFVGTQYNHAKLIDLDTAEVLAELDREKTGGHFCPMGFYVPAFYVDNNVSYTMKEHRYKQIDTQGGGWRRYNAGDADYDKIDVVETVRPAYDVYVTTADYQLHELVEEDGTIDGDHRVEYLNSAFMAGVFWAADYEWLVYRIDINKAIEAGKFEPEQFCFEFDYGAKPEIRQYIKFDEIEVTSNKQFDHNAQRAYYYTQKFVQNWDEQQKDS